MATDRINGLSITGRLKESGITLYIRKGKTIVRSASSKQPKRRTRKQFVARQQLSHSCRLWDTYKWSGKPLFSAGPTAYSHFISLMRRTPVVFFPYQAAKSGETLLLPGMPVSDGVLPIVGQNIGEVNGVTALITDLKPADLHLGDILILFILQQAFEVGHPKLRISRRKIEINEMTEVDGGLALVSEDFNNDMKGWALVRVNGERCSSQTVVTRCTYYLQYTTEEALQEAAKSYGGLTKDR